MVVPSTEPFSRIFVSQRLRLHYVDWGNETALPLVLLHGGQDHCRSWDWVAERLRHDWHVIAPDLRGHGDSQWTDSAGYTMAGFIYDLAELIRQQSLTPVTIVAHSLGGAIASRYAGIFPDRIRKLVAVEASSPRMELLQAKTPLDRRLRDWIEKQRTFADRPPRYYRSIEDAFLRMRDANPRLSAEHALHLTKHGVRQNEDGTYTWKFDGAIRAMLPYDIGIDDVRLLWSRVTCPSLFVCGGESRMSDPDQGDRAVHLRDAEVVTIKGAGHWVHHDRLEDFVRVVLPFLVRP